VNAIRMQNETSGPQIVRFGTFELDVRAGELHKQGVRIKLQEQPLRILEMLVGRPGQLVTRDELRSRLWPSDTFVDFDHGLNKAINKLREALGDSAESPRFIETLAKRGYRFIGSFDSAPGRIQSLAVLPLENLSRDPEQDYFTDGLTEALIGRLAKISSLQVVSRTSVMRYKGAHGKSLREIAAELGADGIVEGTVLRSGKRVRISAQLVNAATDKHVWAETYDRDLSDILALQAEVASSIVREIQATVTPPERLQLARRQEVHPDVYEAYLKGRYFWNKRTLVGMSKGAEYFQQAIAKDPTYAPAHAGLADSAARLGWWGFVSPEEGCARGIAAARRALEIDDTLAEAHAALGFALLHYDCSFRAAEDACRRAIALDPKYAYAAQAHSCCLTTCARFDEGVSEALRAVQLEPLQPILQWTASGMLYHARQYNRAIEQAHRCLELDPSFPPPRWTIALALAKLGTGETGITELEEAVRATGANEFFLGALGYCYAVTGRRVDAVGVLDQFLAASKQRFVSAYWPAVINGALGNRDEAFRLLDIAYRDHASLMAWMKVAPFFDELRSDARFDAMLRKTMFPAS
jgi:TolB-like protein/Flp pilus assembly protein TadD